MPSSIHCLFLLASIIAPFAITSCGSTSALTTGTGEKVKRSNQTYSKVLVRDFTLGVPNSSTKAAAAKREFADQIAEKIKDYETFASVARSGAPDKETLVIGGTITRFEEGNVALRLAVGMGAGSSYFDATTQFTDGSGRTLGQIATDKNSWALGGGLAARQTVSYFIDEAADVVAEEAQKFAPEEE